MVSRVPSSSASNRSRARSTVSRVTSTPQSGQTVAPIFAKSIRRKSRISVEVPTVDRALRTELRCSSAIAGGMLPMWSASGRSSRLRNCRA
jgi:hypothetical protein